MTDRRQTVYLTAGAAGLSALFLVFGPKPHAGGYTLVWAAMLPAFAYRWLRWFRDKTAPYVSSGFIGAARSLSTIFGILGLLFGFLVSGEGATSALVTVAFLAAWFCVVPSTLLGGALILLNGFAQLLMKRGRPTRRPGRLRRASFPSRPAPHERSPEAAEREVVLRVVRLTRPQAMALSGGVGRVLCQPTTLGYVLGAVTVLSRGEGPFDRLQGQGRNRAKERVIRAVYGEIGGPTAEAWAASRFAPEVRKSVGARTSTRTGFDAGYDDAAVFRERGHPASQQLRHLLTPDPVAA